MPTSIIPYFSGILQLLSGSGNAEVISLSTIKQNKISGLASIMAKPPHLQISHQAAEP